MHGQLLRLGRTPVCQHLHGIDCPLGRTGALGAGGKKDCVIRVHVRLRDLGAEPHVDAGALQLRAVELDERCNFLVQDLSCRPCPQLTADFLRAFHQCYFVAAVRGQDGSLSSGRACSNNQYPLGEYGRPTCLCGPFLLGQGRVYHALGVLAIEHPPRDALVDRQAAPDVGRRTTPRLLNDRGISQAGPSHGDEVQLTGRSEHFLAEIRRFPHLSALIDQWLDWQATSFTPAMRDAFLHLVRLPEAGRDHAAIEASRARSAPSWRPSSR